MKNILIKVFLSLFFISSFSSFAQDSVKVKTKKVKEIYLSPTDISPINFALKYKRQLRKKIYFKTGLVSLLGVNSTRKRDSFYNGYYITYEESIFNVSLELDFGIEFRKSINDKLFLFHGPALSPRYTFKRTINTHPAVPVKQRKRYDNDIDLMTVYYSFGLLYSINNHFLVSLEINPSIYFSHYYGVYYQSKPYNNFSFRLYSGSGIVSLAYRF